MSFAQYLSVREVRTTDDAALTVHLMIFYEMLSIETMLDSTNDMIGAPTMTRPASLNCRYIGARVGERACG